MGGEILKLKNIKNGKRKFREWSKLSDRMVDIMNCRNLTMEYELLFQQFQGDHMKATKKIKRRRKLVGDSIVQSNTGQANIGQANIGQANIGQANIGQNCIGQDNFFQNSVVQN